MVYSWMMFKHIIISLYGTLPSTVQGNIIIPNHNFINKFLFALWIKKGKIVFYDKYLLLAFIILFCDHHQQQACCAEVLLICICKIRGRTPSAAATTTTNNSRSWFDTRKDATKPLKEIKEQEEHLCF